jgi:hypothetical protein
MFLRPMFRKQTQYGAYTLLIAVLRQTDTSKY